MGRLVIMVEKGMLSGVFADRPDQFANLEIVAVDYDTDGSSAGTTQRVQGPHGRIAHAHVAPVEIEQGRFVGIEL